MSENTGAIEITPGEEAMARLAAIVESSDDAIIGKTLDGIITSWNKGAERIYGYPAGEAVGQHISFLIPPGHADEWQQVQERVRRGEPVEHLETVRLTKVGRPVDVSLTVSPIFGTSGTIIGVSTIARDITERKRTEQLLRESEQRYRTQVELAPDAVIVHQDGRFLYANCAALGIYGATSLQQLQGMNLLDLVHPDERAAAAARLQQLLDGEQVPLREYRLLRIDGQTVPVEVSAVLIDYQGKPSIQVIARDISERRSSEEKIRESELRHRLLFETSLQGIVYQDADGKITMANPAAEQILGMSSAELLGKTQQELDLRIEREDGSPLPIAERPCTVVHSAGHEARDVVMKSYNEKTDDYRWLSVCAVPLFLTGEDWPTQVYATFEDITGRRRTETALRASEAKFRWLFESNIISIFFWNYDGNIIEANQAYCDLVGVSPEECSTGKLNWLDATPAELFPKDFAAFEEIMAQGACKPYEKEFINRSDGRRVPVLCAGARTAGSEAEGMGFAIDLTELKHAEEALNEEISERLRAVEELHKQQQLLIRQGRLAALGEMIGNIAHQWRQPLNTLALIVQELPWYYERDQFSKEYLDTSVTRAMQVINHMSRTIDGFRNFFQPDKEKVSFPVHEVLAKTVSIVEAAFNEGSLQIEVHADADISVFGCPNEFSQVILNILVNAKDALLERKVERPMVVVRLFRENGRAVLTIADNAGGIPLDIMDKVFDPYFTTKGPDKGTGIGLFMSKTIVEQSMNGTLSVRNTEDGAEFRIEV